MNGGICDNLSIELTMVTSIV